MGVPVDSEDGYHSCSQYQGIHRLAGKGMSRIGVVDAGGVKVLSRANTEHVYSMRAAKIKLPT